MKLHEVYRFKRQALGLSQEEVGKLAGCKGACISNYESGKQISEMYSRAIKNAIDLEIDKLPDIERLKILVLQQAMCLADEENDEKALRSLLYLQNRISQLGISLEKAIHAARKGNE